MELETMIAKQNIDQVQAAIKFLNEIMVPGRSMLLTDLAFSGKRQGFTKRILKTARKHAGVRSWQKKDGQWVCMRGPVVARGDKIDVLRHL